MVLLYSLRLSRRNVTRPGFCGPTAARSIHSRERLRLRRAGSRPAGGRHPARSDRRCHPFPNGLVGRGRGFVGERGKDKSPLAPLRVVTPGAVAGEERARRGRRTLGGGPSCGVRVDIDIGVEGSVRRRARSEFGRRAGAAAERGRSARPLRVKPRVGRRLMKSPAWSVANRGRGRIRSDGSSRDAAPISSPRSGMSPPARVTSATMSVAGAMLFAEEADAAVPEQGVGTAVVPRVDLVVAGVVNHARPEPPAAAVALRAGQG